MNAMNRVRKTWNHLKAAGLAAVLWTASAGIAWAQASPAPKTDDGAPSYIMPYTLVLLGIGLGLLFVLNPSKRRDRPKADQ